MTAAQFRQLVEQLRDAQEWALRYRYAKAALAFEAAAGSAEFLADEIPS